MERTKTAASRPQVYFAIHTSYIYNCQHSSFNLSEKLRVQFVSDLSQYCKH